MELLIVETEVTWRFGAAVDGDESKQYVPVSFLSTGDMISWATMASLIFKGA